MISEFTFSARKVSTQNRSESGSVPEPIAKKAKEKKKK